MNQEIELLSNLNSLFKLLKEEKQALIQNQGHKLSEIVEKKNEYIEKMSHFKGLDIENNRKIMDLIYEINLLQESNLLLTKQAISFQDSLLESISKNLHKISNTYSAKGNYQCNNNINLIDQTI